MTPKLGKMVTYHMVLPPIKSCDPSVIWSFENTWQIKNISIPTVCMATKLGRMVSYLHGLLSTKSHYPWSHIFARWHWSMTTLCMVTKLGRMVTYLNGHLPVKPYDPLITYSGKITWQAITIISPRPQYHGHQTWGDVTYFTELLLTKSHDPLITWSSKTTWQTKTIISPWT